MKIHDEDRWRKLKGTVVGLIVIIVLMGIILAIVPHRFGRHDVEIISIAIGIGALVYFGAVVLGKRSRRGA